MGPVSPISVKGSHEERFREGLLALSVPLLILLALLALLQRSGSGRVQAIPALLIGSGLLVTSWRHRRRRRSELLRALKEEGRPPTMGA